MRRCTIPGDLLFCSSHCFRQQSWGPEAAAVCGIPGFRTLVTQPKYAFCASCGGTTLLTGEDDPSYPNVQTLYSPAAGSRYSLRAISGMATQRSSACPNLIVTTGSRRFLEIGSAIGQSRKNSKAWDGGSLGFSPT